jgi:Phosphotransferase enzyme family
MPRDDQLVGGIQQAVFGEVTQGQVTAWLDRHLRRRLGVGVQQILVRTGRLAAVYGLRLTDGTKVAAKVHRGTASTGRLAAAASCQRVLAEAGYPCPVPLDGPMVAGPRVVVIESWLDRGEVADAHQPTIRRSMAQALARQLELLRAVPAATSPLAEPPAWVDYQAGPWPVPHDPVFDFTVTPAGFEWLDRLARAAADALVPRREPQVIGHSDWYCGNLRFVGDQLTAAYDWDSLTAHAEPILAGVAAGAHTDGSAHGAAAPTPDEVAAFLADHDQQRERPFTGAEQAAAAAAATWVMAYNARCQLHLQTIGRPAGEGSFLEMLARYRGDIYSSGGDRRAATTNLGPAHHLDAMKERASAPVLRA